MQAQYPDQEPIRRGVQLLVGRQRENGEWRQERAVGSGIVTWYIMMMCRPGSSIKLT